jgi:hypothetical protein
MSVQEEFVVASFVSGSYLVIFRCGRVYEFSLEDEHRLSPLVKHFRAWDVRFDGEVVKVYLKKNFHLASRLESASCEKHRCVSDLIRPSRLV